MNKNSIPAVMIQGTGSNVGKSLLVAGLCRYFQLKGLKLAPFKPQNMSNNAAVTEDGGEIGRAQALQAKAAGLMPVTDMNPILLKPESDHGAQIIVQGKKFKTLNAKDYGKMKGELLPKALESYHRLSMNKDLMIIEGAGSPAEVNLRIGDIANMGFAEAIECPVILVGDIDRGGVIASLIGTYHTLSISDRNRIKGFIINRFRGETSLFTEGLKVIEQATGWKSLGIVPWFTKASLFPAEDSQELNQKYQSNPKPKRQFNIAVPRLSRIANFDDLDPLAQSKGVRLTMLEAGTPIAGDTDLVILTGTKNTRLDCDYFKAQGWDIDLKAHLRRGGHVIGICGGYQMLGQWIHDPDGIEGAAGSTQGLGHLAVETILTSPKVTKLTEGICHITQDHVKGYEIHMGRSQGLDCERPFMTLHDQKLDGALSKDGLVMGTYLHGLFNEDNFRQHFLNKLGAKTDLENYHEKIETSLDELAAHLAQHLDLDLLMRLAKKG